MELHKIDEQIQRLQQERKEAVKKKDEQIRKLQQERKQAVKKKEEKIFKDLLSRTFGDNWQEVADIILSDDRNTIEVFVSGKPLREFIQRA